MKKICAALMLSLAACQTTSEPGIEVRTVEVVQPIPVACVDSDSIPKEPPMVGDSLNGNARHDADLLGASAIVLRQWGRELRALIEPSCTKP